MGIRGKSNFWNKRVYRSPVNLFAVCFRYINLKM